MEPSGECQLVCAMRHADLSRPSVWLPSTAKTLATRPMPIRFKRSFFGVADRRHESRCDPSGDTERYHEVTLAAKVVRSSSFMIMILGM